MKLYLFALYGDLWIHSAQHDSIGEVFFRAEGLAWTFGLFS